MLFQIRRHFVTHTREKPFQCNLCYSRFTQSGSLKTHLANVHDLKKVVFKCAYCTSSPVFVTSHIGELRNHIKALHKPQPFSCVLIDEPTD